MKKFIVIVLVAILTLSLCACGNTGENSTATSTGNNAGNNTTIESSAATSETPEWKKFLADYNAWVDQYIELVAKYKANPTDTTILADYTEMSAQVTEWSTRADSITQELTNSPEDAAEYAAELQKIAEKLAGANQ